MKPELVNPLKLNLLNSLEHSLCRFFCSKSEKKAISERSLHLRINAKYIVAVAVISFLLFSFSVFVPIEAEKSNNNTPQNIVESDPSDVTGSDPSDVTKPDSGSDIGNQNSNPTSPPVPSQKTPFQTGFSGDVPSTSEAQGLIESARVIGGAFWKDVATSAWQYFQPEVGVNPDTGLPSAGTAWPYFTGWDLGVYIQAIIDARKLDLIRRREPWGFYDRVDKVLTFLENRKLTDNALPFWWYQAENGNPFEEIHPPDYYCNVADSGRLLVALNNLKIYNNSYATRIANVINRVNYSIMLNEIDTLATSNNIYDYFVVSGFAAFWPEKANVSTAILDNIMSAPQIDMNGAQLPIAKISCEPILLSIFELEQADPRMLNLSKQVYLAHEVFFNDTGQYRAFSEGPTKSGFVYEWVVLPDGRTWIVQNQEGSDLDIVPIVYTKVAFSFLALHNTTFARDIVTSLEYSLPDPGAGYCDGIDEEYANKIEVKGSNTNGLILSAARYAVQCCIS